MTYVLSICEHDIEFELPEDPKEAAELVLYLADEHSGNVLNYPIIQSKKEYDETRDETADFVFIPIE